MGQNRPTQRLRRELLDLAHHQEDLAIQLVRIAEALPDGPGLLMLELLTQVYADADHLTALADEVRQGQVSRLRS